MDGAVALDLLRVTEWRSGRVTKSTRHQVHLAKEKTPEVRKTLGVFFIYYIQYTINNIISYSATIAL